MLLIAMRAIIQTASAEKGGQKWSLSHLVIWHVQQEFLFTVPTPDVNFTHCQMNKEACGGGELPSAAGCVVRHHMGAWRQHLYTFELWPYYKALQAIDYVLRQNISQ